MNTNAVIMTIKNLRDRAAKRSIFRKNRNFSVSINYDNNIIITAEMTSTKDKHPVIYIAAYDKITNAKSLNDAVCMGTIDTCYEITDEIIEQQISNFCHIIESNQLTWNASIEKRDAEWNRWFAALYA